MSYEPPLPTNVRGYDGNPLPYASRNARRIVLRRVPPLIVNALSPRGQDVLRPWRARLSGAVGARSSITPAIVRRVARGRGGSTITQQVAKALLQDDAFRSRARSAGDLASPRIDASSSRSRTVPQPDFLGQMPMASSRGARLFRSRRRELALHEPRTSRSCPGAEQLRPDPARRKGDGPAAITCSAKWPATALSPRNSAPWRLHRTGHDPYGTTPVPRTGAISCDGSSPHR